MPKLPVAEARIGPDGLDGDAHHHDTEAVGEPAHQRHRRVAVQVHEAGDQHMFVEPHHFLRGELRFGASMQTDR